MRSRRFLHLNRNFKLLSRFRSTMANYMVCIEYRPYTNITSGDVFLSGIVVSLR